MDKQEVIDYLMYTPYNTNLAVLKSMLGEGDWDELLDYVKKAPHSVNRRVLEGILGADDYIVLLDGTYEFEDDGGYGVHEINLDKCYEPANVTVTVDGTTVTLPKFESAEVIPAMLYGEFGKNSIPVFTTYPVAVVFSTTHQGLVLSVDAPTAGSHTVKVTVPNGSEVECGGEDEDDGAIVGEAIVERGNANGKYDN